ncbi:glycosyltransferase family 10 [Labrenzia sp. ac12]
MKTAGFLSSAQNWHWERQFPQSIPVWGDIEFIFSGDFEKCDVLIVFDGLPDHYCGNISAKSCVFVASEPANVKTYESEFLSQFDLVLTTDRSCKHGAVQFGQTGLPWLVGAWSNQGALLKKPLNFDFFENFSPKKSKLVSVVSSDKAFTEEHRARLQFVEALKEYFGEKIDYFGRNINTFPDKMSVLSEYKYHIALENCAIKDYWTEKISNSFLTKTLPIYHGCPNISDYFEVNSYKEIDVYDIQNSIKKIEFIISKEVSEFEIAALKESRRKVLYEYNIFSVLTNILKSAQFAGCGPRRRRTINSERFFRKNKSVLKRMRKRLVQRFF